MLNRLVKRLGLPVAAVTIFAGAALPGAETPAASKSAKRPTRPVTVIPITQVTPPEPQEGVAPNPDASLIDDQRQAVTLRTQKLRNEVSNAIEDARRGSDPEQGLNILKQALGSVKSSIDIGPEDRQQLQKRLEAEILQQENQKDIKRQAQVRALESRAQQESIARLSEQATLTEERLENLIDRVRSLMLEGRHGRDEAYQEAQEVADVAINLRPGEGSSAAARFDAEAAHQLTRAYRLRARRADQVLEMLHQVELSHIPFPDEPPIRFPPAEVWKALSERRKQTATVDSGFGDSGCACYKLFRDVRDSGFFSEPEMFC